MKRPALALVLVLLQAAALCSIAPSPLAPSALALPLLPLEARVTMSPGSRIAGQAATPSSYDRIQQLSISTTNDTIVLGGSVPGFRDFSTIENGTPCTYLVLVLDVTGVPNGEWEIARGVYNANTLTRGRLIASSSGSRITVAAGTTRVSLIASSDLLQPRTWNFVLDFSGDNAGTTDMAATMANAFSTVVTAGGGTIYFPPGIYLLSRPCQDTGEGGANAQVPFPTVELDVFDVSTAQPTLRIVGALPPPTSGESSVLPASGHTVFKSTLTGGTGTASVFANRVGRNNLHLAIENIILQLPSDPSVSGWNLADQNDVIARHLLIHSGTLKIMNVVQPTHTNQYAFVMPQNNHSANTIIENIMVWGSYTAYKTGELATVNGAMAESCVRAFLMAFSYHANHYGMLGIYECPYGLVAAGNGDVYAVIGQLDIENANGQYKSWQNKVYHVDDPKDQLHLNVAWHVVDASVGVSHTFTKNGGRHVLAAEPGA